MQGKPTRKHNPQTRDEYLVQVTIVEARNLKGNETGSCDPFIKITVSGQPPQVTATKKQASNCVFNQSFTFPKIQMNQVELESFEIRIEAFDFYQFFSNRLIGQYSIGLSTLFRNPGHEIYNQWLMLTIPEEGLDPQGYILCCAYIISSIDRPPVHDANENQVVEEPELFAGIPDDQLQPEQLQQRREQRKRIAIVQKPELIGKPYQLMVNIYKAEDLPVLTFGSCDSFISVRAGGITQITPVMKNMIKPQYTSRLMFPLFFPLFNDKIVIRVWDRRVCMTDTFIAMIPELPQENDFFNANFLQSRGGVMPFRWFNLYGIPMDERPSNFDELVLGYKKKLLGTQYMGRVCLSLNLTPSEKPEKCVKPFNTFKEPDPTKYILRVDFYEIQDAKDCGEFITVQVRVGSCLVTSPQARQLKPKQKQSKQKLDAEEHKNGKESESVSYVWKEKDIIIKKDEKGELPEDPIQVPDVIISLMSDKGIRQAYLRIPFTHKDLEISKPKWYPLSCVKTKLSSDEGKGDVTHSFCLINVMVGLESKIASIPRIPVKRNLKAKYNLHAYIYAGYDLCPDCYSEEVEVQFEIKIAAFTPIVLTRIIPGKNPIWNQVFQQSGEVDENLEFASNIIVSFKNIKKKIGWFDDNVVGDICIQAFKCGIDTVQNEFIFEKFVPDFKFYHIMNKEGGSVGRILAAFHLQKLKKNQKENIKDIPFDFMHRDSFREKQLLFPIFGVRKLPSKLKDPIIYVRAPIPPVFAVLDKKVLTTQDDDQEKIVKEKVEENPYYNSVPVTALENESGDTGGWFSGGIQDPNFHKVAILNLYVPDDLRFWPQIELELRDNAKLNERYICILSLIPLAKGKEYDVKQMQDGLVFFSEGRQPIEENEEKQIFGDGEKKEEPQSNKEPQQKEQDNDQDKEKVDQKTEQKEAIKEPQEAKSYAMINQEEHIVRNKLLKLNIQNVLVDDLIRIQITEEDQSLMQTDSVQKVSALKNLLTSMRNAPSFDIMKGVIKREIEKCKIELVDEDVFFGKRKNDDDDDGGGGQFDYGRKTLKGPYEDEAIIKKTLPFKRYILSKLAKGKEGIVGTLTTSFIKGDMKLIEKPVATTYKGSKLKTSQMIKSSKKSEPKKSGSKKGSQFSLKKSSKKSMKPKVQENENFNLFDQSFLTGLDKGFKVKVRVYIYRCLNLAAQSQNIDTHHMLAGMNAFCEANPYPEIQIGEKGGESSELIKYVSLADRAAKNTLSPEFFSMHELDAHIPKDWKLTINIKDKGMFDSLIGSVEIDLEDRLFGEPSLKERITFEVLRTLKSAEKEKLALLFDEVSELRKTQLVSQIVNLTQRIDNFDKEQYQIPVEYCELKKPGANNKTSQGTIEMFVEVLPLELARQISPSSLAKPAPMEYEVRLIILETINVPRNPKKNNMIDIFVVAAMDATATGVEKQVEKETDCHMSSEDGNGEFNYRMRFPFIWPCAFPRMKICVYDMNKFSGNDSVGEATISLRRITSKLNTDGKYDMPPTKIKLSHPNFPDSDRGEVYVQMNIVTKQVADGNPVGDAQDEPNTDPYLVKPTAGRSLSDFFKGAGGGRGMMFYLKVVVGVIVLVLVVMVLFVKPGILVN